MFFNKRYSWSEQQNSTGSENSSARLCWMFIYWFIALYFINVVLNLILLVRYNAPVASNSLMCLITFNGMKMYIRAMQKYHMHGALLNISFILAVMWLAEAVIFHVIFRKLWGSDDVSVGNNEGDTTHGSAHWATEEEIRQAGLISDTEGGVVLCRWSPQQSFITKLIKKLRGIPTDYLLTDTGPDHVIMNAPTRAGKGVSGVVPTLLNWIHSVLVLDIKGENWIMTAGWRSRELGQYCFRFDPTNEGKEDDIKNDIENALRYEAKLKGEDISFDELCKRVDDFYEKNEKYLGPARWNPLLDVHIGTGNETAEVQQIATMLADPEGKGLTDYWDKEGFALLTGTITYEIYKARDDGREPSLAGIRQQLTTGDVQCMFEDWLSNKLLTPDEIAYFKLSNPTWNVKSGIHPVVESIANSMKQKADKELSGVIGTAVSNLELYLDSVVGKNTTNGTFTISDLVNSDKPCSLYIIVPPKDLPRLRPLLRLFIVLLINGLTGKMVKDVETGEVKSGHIHRLLLLLDEFPQLKKMDQVQVALAQMAGYGLKAYIIVQSFTQLFTEYGKDENVSGNCNVQIAFAPNDETTAKQLSDMCGKKTEIVGHMSENIDNVNSFGRKRKSRNISYSEHERPLLYPDEVRRLPAAVKDGQGMIKKPGKVLVFPKGFPAIMGEQSLYFKDKEWSRRRNIPAPLITVHTKERNEEIRIAVEKWQRKKENWQKSVTECIEDKVNNELAVLPDKVIKKWFNPVLRRNPQADTYVQHIEKQVKLRKEREAKEAQEKKKRKEAEIARKELEKKNREFNEKKNKSAKVA